MRETPSPKLTLEQIGEVLNPLHFSIEGRDPVTGYTYNFGFIFDHPNGPYIKIDTEPRRAFLAKGSEQQAQDALVDLTQQTRKRSGGVLGVHPFYGAVWGTKLNTVAPDFLTDLEHLDEDLSMLIHLTDTKEEFDEKLTQESIEIGTVVAIPGHKSNRLLEYMRTPKSNPNQEDRDTAIANGLEERWDAEFKKYHKTGDVPPAMILNPDNIVRLMRKLESEVGITDLAVVNYSQK